MEKTSKNTLVLPIKKKWFDMIYEGIKTEEYREIKPYYEVRFQNIFGAILVEPTSILGGTEYQLLQGAAVPEEIREEPIQEIIFRNGYGKNAPEIKAECSLDIGEGKEEWGAEKGKKYFVLKIHRIVRKRK